MGTGVSLLAPIEVRKVRMASHAEVKRGSGRRRAAVGGTGAGGTAAASVAGSEARGGVREDVRFPGGWPQSGRERRSGRTARLRVCERMISNESPVREIRTLGSMSGERKRSRSGVRGTGGMALDAGIRAPSTARPARLSSTLLAS